MAKDQMNETNKKMTNIDICNNVDDDDGGSSSTTINEERKRTSRLLHLSPNLATLEWLLGGFFFISD